MSSDLMPFALVADDDPLVRMNAVDIVEAAGYRTYEAAAVDEALEIRSSHHEGIRLLLTDVQMSPGVRNGFDLARACAEKWPEVHIMVASGLMRPGPGEMPEGGHIH